MQSYCPNCPSDPPTIATETTPEGSRITVLEHLCLYEKVFDVDGNN